MTVRIDRTETGYPHTGTVSPVQAATALYQQIQLSELSIIVINYNGAKFLTACLSALVELGYSRKVREIVVVDNSSSDSSLEKVQPFIDSGDVTWVETGANLGYGGGSNFSFTISDGKYLVVLNPDVVVLPGCLEQMLQVLQTEPSIGILGCKLLYPFEDDQQARIQHLAGMVEYPLALTSHLGSGLLETEQGKLNLTSYSCSGNNLSVIEAEYVTGALVMFRRVAFIEIGGYDEMFRPAYFEEIDLCRRAPQKGWRVASCLSARAIHHESGTLGSESFDYFYYYHSNRLRFIMKHYNHNQLVHDFLPAESRRFSEMSNYILEKDHTTHPAHREIQALVRVYLELATPLEAALVEAPTQEVAAFVPRPELDRKLELLSGWAQLESRAERINQNWRLLKQTGLVRWPNRKPIAWREPRLALETIVEKCRVAYYRRFTMPHILELAAAQERFNAVVTRQVDQLTGLVGQLIQSEINIPGSEKQQFDKALESLRHGIYQTSDSESKPA